jgi:peptide/nickel transport system substrate-binding protein
MRRRRLTALLCAGALTLAACGSDDDDDPVTQEETTEDGGTEDGAGTTETTEAPAGEEEGEPVTGGELVMAVESETNSYLPGKFAGSEAGYNVARSVYDSLMLRDDEGQLQPYLAESIEPNEDLTQYTLKLRPGVLFHDGTPLNAEAIKYAFDNHLKVAGSNVAGNLRDVDSVTVVDDLTVTYDLNRPSAAFPDLLQGPIGWPFSPTAAAAAGEDFGSNPVGTGPFKLVSYTRDNATVLERNEDYWQEGLPYLDRITFRPIPDEESRLAAFESGDVDAVHSVRLSGFGARVRELPDVEVNEGPGNSGSGAIFNTKKPPVDDPRVRRGLSYALDQGALVDVIAGSPDASELRNQYYSETSPYYSEKVAEAWPTDDPEKAKELLDEYINDPQRSDGKAPGSPISVEYNCTAIPSLQEQAQAIQAYWQAVGVEVKLNALEQSVHIQNVITDNFTVGCFRMGGDEDPYITLGNAFGDPATTVTNITNYHNEQVAEIIDTLRTSKDQEERVAAVEELGLLFAEDVPNTWTGGNNQFIATRPEVDGVATWKMPDGTVGNGAQSGITIWGQVWLSE